MSVDDDDDGVEPQIEDVDGYYFQDGDEEPVCFSILPIQFGENDNEADFSRKNVILCGLADKNLVYKEVVAWKTRLDTEQPNIYVLSIEHKWIKLLKPRKCYEKFVRSILITVQMLHFVRRGGQRSCLNRLWDHLDEVFSKYNAKPAADDLMKHLTLIKKFVKKDQTLMKSKILQSLIENGFERTKQALGLEAQFVVSDGRRVRKNDGNNYGYKDDSGGDCDDGDGSIDDGDDSSDDDSNSDDDGSDNDGTDQICAICDDGGTLLSCEGPCKRSFHPTKKDGKESKCETLGYTSAEVKKIGTYLCANCKNKQHQCFRCGELEPSHGPNAKVFQCNHASCGYFYHPKCIAPLLDPNATDGACALERRIMGGMSFPCPIHWCSKCGHMENKTQRALQLAVCRRCTRAYHRKCLPRELSFGTTDKDGNQRAWKLSKTIFIYCLDHEINKDTGAPIRNHIKFPATPECTKTKEFGNSKARMTRKRRKNTNQSTEPIELSNRLCGAESEQADNVGAKSTSPQIVVEPHCAAKRLKDDPQIEQSIIGASSQNGAETMKGHENQFGISSCLASTETEKRVTCLVPKGTCLGTPYDGPSTKGMSDCSVEDTPVDKDVELDNVACRITEDKYANGREKTQDNYTRKETAHHKDSSENEGHNDVLELDILWVEMQADGSPLEPGNKRDKEWQEDAYGPGSALGQEKETSSSPRSDRGMVPRNDCKIIDSRKGGTTVDNVDDHCSEGSYSCQGEWSRSKYNDCDQDTLSDRSKKRSQSVEKASDGNKTDLDENKKHNLREDGKYAQYEDRRTERNTAADTSRYKCRDKTQSDRREEPEGRSTPAKSREHPPERQRMDHSDSCPETYNRQRCEPSPETYNRQRCELPYSVNSSRSGGGDRRQGSPCQSSFPLAEFGGDHSHLPPRDSQYRTSPQYLGIPQYDTSRMGSPIPHPRMNHTVDWDTFRDHLRAKYDAMDTGPDRNAGAYRAYKTASVAEHSVVCYQLAGGYGDGSRSSRPVTDKYAPHLDRTNCINQRSQSYLPYDLLQLLYNKYVV